MVDKGLGGRRSLAVAGMSASAYRYATQPDRNVELRQRIQDLAQRHKRYGVGMIQAKLPFKRAVAAQSDCLVTDVYPSRNTRLGQAHIAR
jgi:hypothetical protein